MNLINLLENLSSTTHTNQNALLANQPNELKNLFKVNSKQILRNTITETAHKAKQSIAGNMYYSASGSIFSSASGDIFFTTVHLNK